MTPASRMTDDNANSSKDYRPGSRPPFVYKSGPDWPNDDPEFGAPVAGPFRKIWPSVAERVKECLASCNVKWRSIVPHSCANEGEEKPFCPLIICVGVNPNSLQYEDAVRAADGVKEMLTDAGWPEVEIGFMEVSFWGALAGGSRDESRDGPGGDSENRAPLI